MKRYYFFFFLFLFSSTTFSQISGGEKNIDVYPVRVNHKWGYVKFYPSFVDTLIQPRYDYIGDINLPWNTTQRTSEIESPFRIFEIDEKVGLLDLNLQELLPNKYNRIRPLSPQYFAVEKDSLFVLIDLNENEFFDGQIYNDIKSDRSDDRLGYFFVKKDNKWGIRKLDGPLLVDYKYIELKSMAVQGYFLAKTRPGDFNWMLIDSTGKKVLPGSYSDVKIVDHNVIAAKRPIASFFNIYRKKVGEDSYVRESEKYSMVGRINEQIYAVIPYKIGFNSRLNTSPKDTVELWNLQENKRIKSYPAKQLGRRYNYKIIPSFYSLDDNYAILEKEARDKKSLKQFLIDFSGNIASAPFDTILCTKKEGVYFAGRKFSRNKNTFWKWGLIAPDKDNLCSLDCIYDEILDFENDIAIIYSKSDGYGAIAIRENQAAVLECVYTNIFKSDKNTLQVETQDDLTVIYKLTDDLQFIEDALYEKAMIFSENIKPQFQEVETSSILRIKRNSSAELEKKWPHFSFKYITDTLQLFNEDTLIKQTGIKEKASILVEMSSNIFAFYHKNKKIETPFTKDFFGESVALISMYDFNKNTLISNFQMIGFRPFRNGYKYTAFLDPDGKMGLMDRAGNQLLTNGMPLRYSYVGDFFANRARVCLGGQLFIDREDNLEVPSQFRIHTKQYFKATFKVSVTPSKDYDVDKYKNIYVLSTPGNHKWGYIDERGELILEPDADFILDFNAESGSAKILKKNNRDNKIKPGVDIGLIDPSGHLILDINYNEIKEYVDFYQIAADSTPTFYFTKKGHQLFVNRTKLRSFYEGFALFSNDENKWGYLDTLGEIVIAPQYSLARPFSDGVAMVVDSTGYCSFIDIEGTILFRSIFTEKQWRGIGDFHEGRVWFKRSNGWIWGCYNKNGEEVISPKFYYKIKIAEQEDLTDPYYLPMDFSMSTAAVATFNSDGKAFASIIDSIGNKKISDQNIKNIGRFDEFGLASYTLKNQEGVGVLNSSGEKLTEPVYTKINPFIDGYAKVLGENQKWGLINTDGKQLIPCIYNQMGQVSEGLVAVNTSRQKAWFFVDLENVVKIKGPFQKTNPFKGGVTLVSYENKEQFITKNGDEIYIKTGKPRFFSEGILGITKQEKTNKKEGVYFYADESGNNIFGRYFSQIKPFKSGIAEVIRIRSTKPGQNRKRELWGAINKRGVMVVPPKFRTLHLQSDGNVIINPQLFWGITNKEGKVLLEPIYDKIDYFSKDGILRIEQGEKIGYVYLKENDIEWIWDLQF